MHSNTNDSAVIAVSSHQRGCHVTDTALQRNNTAVGMAATEMYFAQGSFLLTAISQTVATTDGRRAH